MTAIAELPGPRTVPLLGNAHRLAPGRLHVMIEQWGRRYGPAFRFAMGPREVVAFADPEAVNTILRERPDAYRRWRELEQVTGELRLSGPFTSEGDDWRRQRRLAVTALNSNHLRRYFDIIERATRRLHRRLPTGEPVEILEDFMSYSVDITSALAFGHDLNTLEHGDGELQHHITRAFELVARRTLAPFPYWKVVKPPVDRAAERSIAVIHEEIAKFIAAARRRMDERPELREQPENFLESMLTTPDYDEQDIFGNVFTMLLAGEDTTANTLAWATYLLARDPTAQRRLHQEAENVLEGDALPTRPEQIDRMHFAEAVFREAARLKSTAPLLFFEAIHDTSAGDVELPAGTRIICLTRQIACPRGDRFDPGRWLTADHPDPRTFLSFGAGPRFCPGRNLAFLEGKTALTMLARNYTWEPAGAEPRERFGFTMRPTGLQVLLRPRKVRASNP